jgi:hypothetical protein
MHYEHHKIKLGKQAPAATLLTGILEVLSSNLCQGTRYHRSFHGLPQSSQAKIQIVA